MARGGLTDDEWSLIDPHLPLGKHGPIPDLRQQFNAVMWRFRTGSPWRDLPVEYGPWSTVYDRFRSWAVAGVFEQLMQAVIAEAAARGRPTLTWSVWTPPVPAPTTTPPEWSWTLSCSRRWRRPASNKRGYAKGAKLPQRHTREYDAFCRQVAGRFIHHTSDDTPGESGTESSLVATMAAMEATGYRVDPAVWPSAAGCQQKCNQCHAGCYDSPKKAVG